MKTQKVYTYSDRKLYGEYDLFGLLKLRMQIAKGEISETLCYILSNDRAVILDEFGIPDFFSKEDIEEQYSDLLREYLHVQMDKRIKENKICKR